MPHSKESVQFIFLSVFIKFWKSLNCNSVQVLQTLIKFGILKDFLVLKWLLKHCESSTDVKERMEIMGAF